MSRSNFVGTKLINLKDKLSANSKTDKNEVVTPLVPQNIVAERIDTQKVQNEIQPDNTPIDIQETSFTEAVLTSQKEDITLKIEQKKVEKLDKHLIKALKDRKEDYLRSKEVVLKIISETLSEITKSSREIENKRNIYLDYIDKLQGAVSEINSINEAKWSDYDYSIDLADAGKLVEHARIESLICRDKLRIPDKVSDELITKTSISPADIFSSSFSQVFKFGFKLFLPLIIGVIIAALIISLTILLSMG